MGADADEDDEKENERRPATAEELALLLAPDNADAALEEDEKPRGKKKKGKKSEKSEKGTKGKGKAVESNGKSTGAEVLASAPDSTTSSRSGSRQATVEDVPDDE